MAVDIGLSYQLFPVDRTSTTVEDILTGLGNLEHSTAFPGGFKSLTFVKELNMRQLEHWIENRKLYHLLVRQNGGRVIWDGRIESRRFDARKGMFPVVFTSRGYFFNFADSIDDTDHAAIGETIIKNLRDNMSGNTDQLNTSDVEITATTATLTLSRAGLGLYALDTIIAPDGLLAAEDNSTPANRIDCYIYENGIVHYKARNPTQITWRTSLEDGAVMSGADRWEDQVNAPFGLYDNAGTPTLTAVTTDAVSIARTIRREGVAGSSNVNSATAILMRDKLLAERKDGLFRIESIRLANIRDRNGAPAPLCNVRAGDVIKVEDIFPNSATASDESLNNRDTFFIEATRCRHTNGSEEGATELILRLDAESLSLGRTLARNRVL